MFPKRLLAFLLATLVPAAPALADPTGAVSFAESYGPMTPRYRRALSGMHPDAFDLSPWRLKLLSLRNLQDVHFTRKGDQIEVSLTEVPYVTLVPRVLPYFFPVGLEVGAEDWRLGGQYYDFKAWGGYVWSGVTLYEPDRKDASPRGWLSYNFPEAYARAGVMVLPYTRVYLEGKAAGAQMEGLAELASGYGTIQGAVVTLSPFIRYDDTDHPDMPRMGTRARAGVLFGPRWAGNSSPFRRYDATLQEYLPLGERDSLAIALHGGLAQGELPLAQAYWLGAGNFLRGYSGSRFIGDQMLSASVELRHALFSDLIVSGLTVWSAGFVDLARSWKSGTAIAFPDDLRPAIGGYLGLSLGGWYIGRLEAAVGNEGPFVSIAAGLPFPW